MTELLCEPWENLKAILQLSTPTNPRRPVPVPRLSFPPALFQVALLGLKARGPAPDICREVCTAVLFIRGTASCGSVEDEQGQKHFMTQTAFINDPFCLR